MRKKLLALLSAVFTVAIALSLVTMTAFADSTATDYSKDATKWTWTNGIEVGENGMSVTTANQYIGISKPVAGNIDMTVTLDESLSDGTWQCNTIFFKLVDDFSSIPWCPGHSGTPKGNFLAFVLDHGPNTGLYECVDGVATKVVSLAVSGYDNWYLYAQKSTITIKAVDTADGVDVVVTFTASDCRKEGNTNTGTTYTYTYSSKNTKLWGEGYFGFYGHGDGSISGSNYININTEVVATESGFDYVAPTAVDYAKDASKWQTLSSATVTADGITTTTANGYLVVSNELEGNSEITFTIDENLADGSWQYNRIFFKADNTDAFSWSPDAGMSSVGNWLALVVDHGIGHMGLYECVDGVVTKVANVAVSGYDNWYLYAQKNTVTIKTTDTADGVDVEATFKASDCRKSGNTNTGNTYTYNYSSTNKKLWGKGILANAAKGGGTISETNYIKINAFVIENESEYDYVAPAANDYAADSSKWLWTDGVSISETGTAVTAANQYIGIGNPVEGNVDLTFVVDSSLSDGSWQYNVVFVKVDDFSAIPWSPTNGKTSKGNWIAFVLNHGETDAADVFGYGNKSLTGLYECVDGVVSKVADVAVSGYDNWYLYNQKNTITVKTVDTADGVDVVVAFKASDCRKSGNTNTGNAYTYTYSSTNKKLWGKGHFGYYGFGGGSISGSNYINISALMVETASEYTKENYEASIINELIEALPAEINGNTYGAGKEAYEAAKTAYDAASDAVKALVVGAEKIEAIGAAIAEYEANNTPAGISEKIAALVTEITKENYAEASVAIREAKALYEALSAEDQALVENVETLNNIYNALVAYEADVKTAGEVDALIAALPAEVNRVNYNTALVEQFAAVEAAYAALTDAQKAHLTKVAEYEAATASLAAYIESIREPEADPANLAQKAENWNKWGNVNAGAVEFSNYGMTLNAPAGKAHKAMLLSKNVKADSTISVTFDGQANDGMWGQNFVMFKNVTATENLEAGAPVNAVDHGGIAAAPAGTWMALMFGDSCGFYLYICVDGNLQNISFSDVSGADYNDAVQQISEIVIRTVDTAEGVEVFITFTASGIAGVTGTTYELEYTYTGTEFHGDYAASVGSYYGEGGEQKVIVTEVKVEGPGGAEGLVDRVPSDNNVNFATDLKYWKAGSNVGAFSFGSKGMTLWDVGAAGMLLNTTVKDQQTVKINIDGTLNANWGNIYFVFKHKEPTTLLNGTNFPAASGNYMVLMIGGDGCKIYECVNGSLNATLESNGAITGGTELKVEDNTDAWYIYKQYTRIEIYTEDVEDGVEVFITLKGASGKTSVLTYFSENTALHGDSYFGIEYYLGAAGGANGNVTIESLKIDGVTEVAVPEYDVAAINAQIEQAAATAVTAENVADMEALYTETAEKYAQMNYSQLGQFNATALATVKANVEGYYADVEAAGAVSELFGALSATVSVDTYEAVKAAYVAAQTAYNALGDAGKAAVENKANYEACGEALAAYEADVAAAEAVDELINALPVITKENYAEAKPLVEAAEAAYEALTDAQKAFVKGEEALKAKRNELEQNSSGCAAGMGVGSAFALAMLAVAALLKKKRA